MRYVWVVTLTPSKWNGHGGTIKQYAITEEDEGIRTAKVKELTDKYTKSNNWEYTVIRIRVV